MPSTSHNNPAAGWRRSAMFRRAAGFTLVEMLIAVAIAAILATMAVPTYTSTISLYRVSTEVNGIVSDLQYARSEAVKQGVTVTMCASTDLVSCNGSSWSAGHIVLTNPSNVTPGTALTSAGTCSASMTTQCPTLLRTGAAFSGTDSVNVGPVATAAVSFSRFGYAGSPGGSWNSFAMLTNNYIELTVHPTTPSNGDSCVVVSNIGKVTVLSYNATSTTATASGTSVSCS